MEIKEFRNNILKLNSPKKHTITNSYGVHYFYKVFRQMYPEITIEKGLFCKIVRDINKEIMECLFRNSRFSLPHRIGHFYIVEYDTYVRFENGKIKTNMPVDWNKTYEYWFNNPNIEKKKVIRNEVKVMYRLCFLKKGCFYKNRKKVRFRFNRSIKKELSLRIKENKISGYEF